MHVAAKTMNRYTHTRGTTTVTTIMKSTKVQTLGGIWRKYWGIFGLKTPFHAYVLGEHTSMKNEL